MYFVLTLIRILLGFAAVDFVANISNELSQVLSSSELTLRISLRTLLAITSRNTALCCCLIN